MASLILKTPPTFPDGTTVGAYLSRSQTLASTGPLGSPVNEQVASGGQVTFTSLTFRETYVAFGFVDGQWKRIGFSVDPPAADVLEYFTTAGTAAFADLTAFGRSWLAEQDADGAAETLGALTLTPTSSERNVIDPAAGIDPLWVKNSQDVSHHEDLFTVPAGTKMGGWDEDGNFHGGPNEIINDAMESTMHGSLPDLLFNQHIKKFFSRSAFFGECGDPPEVWLTRAGPNNEYPIPDAGPTGLTGLTNTTSLGKLAFGAFCTPGGGTPGVTGGARLETASAVITANLEEDAFNGAVGAKMLFQTAPIGSGTAQDRMTIFNHGRISIGSGTARGMLFVQNTVADKNVLTLFAHAAQSTDILAVNNGAGTEVVTISSGGGLNLKATGGALTMADGANIGFGTVTGTKIGTGVSQKLAFYNATPVVQPSGIGAAATDPATTQALANNLRTALINLGLVAA